MESENEQHKPSFEKLIKIKEMDLMIEETEQSYTEKESPAPVTWADINQRVYVEDPWRIRGLIPKQGSVILAAISGEKKTWVAMEMARSIAEGRNFLGEDRFATEGGNVLYLNCENPWNEMQRRGRQLGFSDDSPHKLLFVNRDDVNLAKTEGIAWFLAMVEYYNIQVVFVDTFRSVAGALKEEKAEEIRQFFNYYQRLKNQGVTVVWLDHFRKPSNLDGKVPKKEHLLGSQDKAASVEILLMLKSEGAETNVYQRKNRLAIEVPPFKVTMNDEDLPEGRKTIFAYAGELDEMDSKKDEAKELVLTLLEQGPKTTKEIIQIIKKQVGSKNTRAALAELVQEGLLDMAKRSRENLYFIPKEQAESAEKDTFNELDKIFDSS